MKRSTVIWAAAAVGLAVSMGAIWATTGDKAPTPPTPPTLTSSPIQHVVVIFQENHSFDNVLGGLCTRQIVQCDGASTGRLFNGRRIKLLQATDFVADVGHSVADQNLAIHGGKMNGFDHELHCSLLYGHRCYAQYKPSQIPNLRKLAEAYTVSDRTFSENPVPSWGGHLDLVAGTLNGFTGDNPGYPRRGWGCDSYLEADWRNPATPLAPTIKVPACVPRQDGFGPYRPSPVAYVPTIMDRLRQKGLSWRLYSDTTIGQSGYRWSVCPSFAECIYDKSNGNRHDPSWQARSQFSVDAAAGRLPAYSAIMPSDFASQHNATSMKAGDNYIAALVRAVMNGPKAQWQSTVFFITYDDCGCFYDHVPPPGGLGIRVPMVIVGPKVKAHYVDHTVADFDSMLAFVQTNWNLAPLNAAVTNAYNYCHVFTFTTMPCTGGVAANQAAPGGPLQVPLKDSRVPPDAYATRLAASDPT